MLWVGPGNKANYYRSHWWLEVAIILLRLFCNWLKNTEIYTASGFQDSSNSRSRLNKLVEPSYFEPPFPGRSLGMAQISSTNLPDAYPIIICDVDISYLIRWSIISLVNKVLHCFWTTLFGCHV